MSAHTGLGDPATQQWLAQAHAQGLTGAMARVIEQQSFMIGLNEMYWLAGWVFLALTALIWFSRPSQQ